MSSEAGTQNIDSKKFWEFIVPEISKFIRDSISDYKSEIYLQLNTFISGEQYPDLDDAIKARLVEIKNKITTDVTLSSVLTKEVVSLLKKEAGIDIPPHYQKILQLALQGIKIRQPLMMGQIYYTTPAFGPVGSAKVGLQINIIPPSIFDSLLGTTANKEFHIQVFIHNELGASINCFDFSNDVNCFGYGILISHDGLDFTIRKDEKKWIFGDTQLIVERVVRGEVNPGWNHNGINAQYTTGSDYVSQRFFPLNKTGFLQAATHIVPKWVAGGIALNATSLISGISCISPGAVGTAAAVFHSTDQLTKYASDHVKFMRPDKEFRLVELLTLSAPLDGGYTHNSGFGLRGMLRANGGVGTLRNNVNLSALDEVIVNTISGTQETELRHRRPQQTEL